MHIACAGGGTQVAQVVSIFFGGAGVGWDEVGKFVVFAGRERAVLLFALQFGLVGGELGIGGDDGVVDVLGCGHGGFWGGWGIGLGFVFGCLWGF